MATHVGTSSTTPSLPIGVRSPGPRLVATLVAIAVAALVASFPGEVAAAAHAACTLGNPEDVTCGEALVLLGYP